MATNIVVPELGGTSKAKVTHWFKKAGDYVNAGDVVLEIETQKATLEVNAEASGILTQINFEEGATAKIGDVLAIIDETAAQA